MHKALRTFGSYPPLHRWERSFQAAARSDNYALLCDHMGKLGLLPEPELMIEGTITVVVDCLTLDAIVDRPFLEMQQYDPAQATNARYAFTFDFDHYERSYGRLLVNSRLENMDLADLFDLGYSRIWISHPDWSPLTNEELQQLKDDVTSDLLHDYGEDELAFWFQASPDKSFLLVNVQEIWTEEEAESEEAPD